MKNVFIILLGLAPFFCLAQTQELTSDLSIKDGKKNEISLFVGMSSYEGDLHHFDDANLGVATHAKLAFGLSYKKEINEKLTASISYNNIKIAGDDKMFSAQSGHVERGFEFTNNLHEISLRMDYLPFGKKSWKLQPFVFAGAGLAFGSADVDFNNVAGNPISDELINDDMENSKNVTFALPVGFGAKLELTRKISLGLEFGLRLLTNDYLDGVSKAGNSGANDFYGVGGFTLGYKL